MPPSPEWEFSSQESMVKIWESLAMLEAPTEVQETPNAQLTHDQKARMERNKLLACNIKQGTLNREQASTNQQSIAFFGAQGTLNREQASTNQQSIAFFGAQGTLNREQASTNQRSIAFIGAQGTLNREQAST